MDVFEAIRDRRSVRSFSDEPVSKEQMNTLLEAGRQAPSAGNLQARDFFVITSEETKQALVKAALGQTFIAQAPVVIVVCANIERVKPYGSRGIDLYCLQDAAASVQNMLLAAHAIGLSSCWVGAFDEAPVYDILDLPPHLRPVAIIPFGHPAEEGKERPKRTDDIHWHD